MIDIQYVLRTLVYLQPYFWLYLLFSEKEREHVSVKVYSVFISIFIYFYVFDKGISFSQYTTELIGFYILCVLLSFGFFYTKFSFKDAVSLAFLIVFINSYYWESIHHFNVILFYGISFNQITQMFHLLPAYFLIKRLEFHNNKKVIKSLLYGMVVSAIHLSSLYVFHEVFGDNMYYITTPFTRVFTLGILINIVLNDISKIKKRVNVVVI